MSDYWLTKGRKRGKTTYHTDKDCVELQQGGRQSISERYIQSKASLTECSYCTGDHGPNTKNNRGIYNALRNADAEDLSAD